MKSKELKIGSLLSYAGVFVNIIISLVLSPFTVRMLGQAQFGLYQLIWSFVGYMGVLDFGFSNTLIRYIAKYHSEGKQEEEQRFLGMSFIIYGAISALILIAGTVLYSNLSRIFPALSPNEMALAKKLFIIMVCNFILNIFLNVFPAVINAYERFIFIRSTALIRTLIRTGVVVAALLAGGQSLAIAWIDTAFSLFFFALYAWFVRVRLHTRIRFGRLDWGMVREVFGFSFFVFLVVLVDQINWKVDQLILGVKRTVSEVAVYSIAMQFPTYLMSFGTSISGVFLPKATQMEARGEKGEAFTDLMVRTARVEWTVLGAILIGFALFGREFILLWLGEGFLIAYPIALMVMAALAIPMLQSVGILIQQAKNMHRFRAVVYFSIAVANVFLSVWLVDRIGMIGAAVGTVFSFVVGNVLFMNLYYHFKMGINIPRFFIQTAKGLLPATCILIGCGLLMNLFSGTTWFRLALKVALFLLLYLIIIFFVGQNRQEKEMYLELLHFVRRNPK